MRDTEGGGGTDEEIVKEVGRNGMRGKRLGRKKHGNWGDEVKKMEGERERKERKKRMGVNRKK